MKDKKEALEYAQKWLKIIKQEELPDKELGEWIIKESVSNFKEHFNKGWLENRKSITQAGEWAVTEWNGKGAMFRDVMGRKYIDFLGGYGLMSHGWSNPDIIEAVNAQLLRSPMPSQELMDPLRGAFARIMSEITPGKIKYSFFAASGTEAVEGAIKLAKLYTKKDAFIVATDAFHGKTMGSLSMIGKSNYREPLGVLYGGHVYHIPFGDADALEQQLETCRKIGIGVAAVMFEPIQGEAGAIVPPDDFWPRARELTKRYETLLIADEVQTGLGRTGKFWGVENWDVAPDIMTSGKALGGGVMPVSSFSAREEIWQSMMYPNPFIHTTTTGGGALACAAAIASISVALRDDYPKQAEEKGNYIKKELEKLAEKYPNIYHKITGKGLLLGQHFVSNDIGYKVSSECFKRGLLVAGTLNSSKTIRVEPPIVITYEEIDEGLNRLKDALKAVSKMCDDDKKRCRIA
nr:aminotransferase class III-fold pyridoxal phosphate-dependent enzyme [Candidatus Gracilibacteria bacterium]